MLTALFLATACYWPETLDPQADDEAHGTDQVLGFDANDDDAPVMASAELVDRSGRTRGVLQFSDQGPEIRIEGELHGLEPSRAHGLHIHENATCGDPADGFRAAGGHYAPEGHPHGAPEGLHHAGDLGNVLADDDGIAMVVITTDALDTAGRHSVLPRTVVLHAGSDDLHTQPGGDAGERLACGEIRQVMAP